MSLLATAISAQVHHYAFEFDPTTAAGIRGHMLLNYDFNHDMEQLGAGFYFDVFSSVVEAQLIVQLDFSQANVSSLSCNAEDMVYKWTINTMWSDVNATSFGLDQCAKEYAGNVLDLSYICGPDSEHADEPDCLSYMGDYDYLCEPSTYAEDWSVCQEGDLSGKFGVLAPKANGIVNKVIIDEYSPGEMDIHSEWNLVLSAMCQNTTERIACAVIQAKDAQGDTITIE